MVKPTLLVLAAGMGSRYGSMTSNTAIGIGLHWSEVCLAK